MNTDGLCKCEDNPGEFQHALVIADIDKKKVKNVVRKTCAERKKISLLKDEKIRIIIF